MSTGVSSRQPSRVSPIGKVLTKAAGDIRRPSARDGRIDFFRGIALIFIYLDHIPGNLFGLFTLHSFGFSDAAEVFVFISGFVSGLVYLRLIENRGYWAAQARAARRCLDLYVTHVFCLFVVIAVVSWFGLTHHPQLIQSGLSLFFERPADAFTNFLTMRYVPSFFFILPLYIVLLTLTPVFLSLYRRSRAIAAALVVIVYLLAQIIPLQVPGYPEGAVWTFNPFAWQFLFFLAMVIAIESRRNSNLLPRTRPLFLFAVTGLILSLVAKSSAFAINAGLAPSLGQLSIPMIGKAGLEPLRLLHFLLLAYVVVYLMDRRGDFSQKAWARPLACCGRHSLQVFGLSLVLSQIAAGLLWRDGSTVVLQTVVSAAGVLMLLIAAWLLEYSKAERPLPSPAV